MSAKSPTVAPSTSTLRCASLRILLRGSTRPRRKRDSRGSRSSCTAQAACGVSGRQHSSRARSATRSVTGVIYITSNQCTYSFILNEGYLLFFIGIDCFSRSGHSVIRINSLIMVGVY